MVILTSKLMKHTPFLNHQIYNLETHVLWLVISSQISLPPPAYNVILHQAIAVFGDKRNGQMQTKLNISSQLHIANNMEIISYDGSVTNYTGPQDRNWQLKPYV